MSDAGHVRLHATRRTLASATVRLLMLLMMTAAGPAAALDATPQPARVAAAKGRPTPPPPSVNDFPTAERVAYVQDCMREHPGGRFEMLSKCSCALDHIAGEIPFGDYVALSTIAKAMSIGGERGSAIRDAPALTQQARRLKDIQARALQACFLVPDQR